MNAFELLGELRRLGVAVRADGQELRCRAPQGVLTPALLDELRRLKADIITYLADAVGEDIARAPSIPRVPRGDDLPLSFGQQRLWLLDRLTPKDPSYNISVAARLTGPLDDAALQRSLTVIVTRHEALRTVFAAADGAPRQVIRPPAEVPLPHIDLGHVGPRDREAEIHHVAQEYARRPFDLQTGPLFRAALLRVEDAQHVLLFSMHHIVADGWSLAILVRELASAYSAVVAGRSPHLADLPVQYADYAVWQRQHLSGATLQRLKTYWERRLAGQVTSPPLGRWQGQAGAPSNDGTKHPLALPASLADGLLALSRREGTRLFMTLMAGLYVLLARYSGERDLSVGFPIANRTHPQIEPLIGFFANTLILRQDLHGNPTFRELLGRVRGAALDAFTHQDMPFDYLTEILRPDRDVARNPLFSVLFALQNAWLPSIEFGNVRLSPFEVDNRTAKFDLNLTLSEQAGTLQGWIQYRNDLFEPADISRMAGHLRTLLESAVGDPDAPVQSLSLLTDRERRGLVALSSSRLEPPADARIHELFGTQATRTPERVAVECRGARLTYGGLSRRAASLAARLRELGVGPDVPVGIYLERSVDVITAILATWKGGGAYLPLDRTLPRERLTFMVEDAQPRAVVTSSNLVNELSDLACTTVCVDAVPREDHGWYDLPSPGSPDNLAYLIYTSGSTGVPKAVAISHRSVSNLVRGLDEAIYAACRRAPLAIGLNGPFSFDTSVKQIVQLGRGHVLHLLPDRLRSDPHALIARLRDEPLDVLDCTPSQLRLLLEAGLLEEPQCASMTLLVGGEPIDKELWTRLAATTNLVSYNLYGPTECTVDATTCRVQMSAAPTIGRPLTNVRTYVLDGRLQPAPIGITGELYIGGSGVGRGYYRQPGPTAESFLPDPYTPEPGARMYRTRDVARWLAGGDLEFVGRTDRLVKLRGHRIELEEIEAALRSHPAVAQAAVLMRQIRPGDARVVAYVCPSASGRPRVPELRRFLRNRLPAAMRPAEFVWLDTLPLNENGKTDYDRLPALDAGATERHAGVGRPRDLIEFELVRIWEDLLRTRPIQITDDFFELGGHSFLAVIMVGSIKRRFGCDVPLAALFEHPTVEQLAGAIRQRAVASWSPLVAIQAGGSKPPFFCVHPVGGNVLCYLELAEALGADQPFYAFQSAHVEAGEHARSIGEMASRYINEMRRVQPHGPYRLGGWSVGGIVAFEMGRQLDATGEEVACLALFDSRAPYARRWEPVDDAILLTRFATDLTAGSEKRAVLLEAIDAAPPGNRARCLLEAAVAHGALPPDVDEAHMRHLIETFQVNLHAARSYEPFAAHVTVTLVHSEVSAATWGEDSARAWSTLASGGLTRHVVPGDHHSMMRRPNVETVARILCAALEHHGRAEGRLESKAGEAAPAI